MYTSVHLLILFELINLCFIVILQIFKGSVLFAIKATLGMNGEGGKLACHVTAL